MKKIGWNTSYIKLFICTLLVIVSDILFYNNHTPGWVTGLFCLLLLISTSVFNYSFLNNLIGKLLILLCMGQTLAMVEFPGKLNILLFFILLTAIVSYSKTNTDGLCIWFRRIASYMLIKGWLRLPKDFLKFVSSKCINKNQFIVFFISLIVPVGFTFIFASLFYMANPLLEKWIDSIDFHFSLNFIIDNISRIFFWSFMAAICWAYLAPKFKISSKQIIKKEDSRLPNVLCGSGAILYSLLIFNIIFLVQNLMDVVFIWGGSELPDGLTYAKYAHQGAYPLVISFHRTGLWGSYCFPDHQKVF